MSVFEDMIAHHIAVDLGFITDENAVFEPHYTDEGLLHYTFGNEADATGIIIKCTPEELDLDW
ncbi:hypothetical protein ES703_105852 [subsurface metagenome]